MIPKKMQLDWLPIYGFLFRLRPVHFLRSIAFALFALCTCNNLFASTIIDLERQQTITQDQLISVLRKADFILLGELHDNPYHHQIRGQIIKQISNKKYSIVVEYLLADQKVKFSGSTLQSLEEFGYSPKAWPWKIYQPLFEDIRASGLTIYGSNLERNISKALFTGGALPPNMQDAYDKSSLDTSAKRQLDQDLIDGHCGKLPAHYLEPMFKVQRLTDISMAQVMIAHQPAILLAGNGHIRRDYGVPQVLTSLTPSRSKISVGFVEEEKRDAKTLTDLHQQYDFIWITPSIKREDPCANLHFGKSQSSK